MKVNINQQKKEKIVEELINKVQKAKALVFTNYQGMTHQQMEELKKALKVVDAELVVAKNTLLKLALDKTQSENKGPTATIFAYSDPIAAIKELAKTIKKIKLPIIKSGILEGKILAEAEINRLSTLPSREQLISYVIYGIKAPIFGLHRALNWNLRQLILTLNAIKNKKMVNSEILNSK